MFRSQERMARGVGERVGGGRGWVAEGGSDRGGEGRQEGGGEDADREVGGWQRERSVEGEVGGGRDLGGRGAEGGGRLVWHVIRGVGMWEDGRGQAKESRQEEWDAWRGV